MTFDLAFIGGGLACTFTWEALLRGATPGAPLRFVMIDRDGSFGTGIPYGGYAEPAYLLNDIVAWNDTAAGDLGWLRWLRAERSRWLTALEACADPAVAHWLARNRAALDRDELERIYMPRSVFGQFLTGRFERHVARVAQLGHALDLVSAEVTDIARGADGVFSISHAGEAAPIRARNVLLGIGLPVGNRWPELDGVPGYISIRNVHSNALAARLDRTDRADPIDVAILGGGPSAVEMAYRCLTRPDWRSRIRTLTLVTTSGDIPRVGTERVADAALALPRLAALKATGVADAGVIFEAMRDDIADARAIGYPWICALPALSAAFGPLVLGLPLPEKRRWLREFSERVLSLLKSTSMDYEQTVRQHTGAPLEIRAGRVESVARAADRFAVAIADRAGARGQLEVDVVVNCLGTTDVRTTESPLLAKLLARGLVQPNEVGRGVQVDEEFAASPGLFVLGPLLSGTCNSKFMCMRLETITRTLALSTDVAAAIARQL